MRACFDLHCHSHFSADGVSTPEQMVTAARSRGLAGFAITDHNTCEAVDYFRSRGFLRGDGYPVEELLIVPGVEVSTAEGHLLCLGVAEFPRMVGEPAAAVCAEVHRLGGVAIPAHPYDKYRSGIREGTLDRLPLDAIEVFNAASTRRHYNTLAAAYAARRNLPGIAASDSHHPDALGRATTTFELAEISLKAILTALRQEPAELVKNYLTPRDFLIKTFHNFFRFKKSRG